MWRETKSMIREKVSVPRYLYHYTSIESLAMILSKKAFRLSRLSDLDDLLEAKTADISKIGDTVYVSSWTDEAEESIPMWNMYSQMSAGVRIKSISNIFEDYKILPDRTTMISDNKFYTDDRIIFPQQLEKVIYSDLKSDLFPQIVYKDQGLNQEKFGKYKSSTWAFQKEWRYIVRTWYGKNFDESDMTEEEKYIKFSKIADKYIYLKIKEEAFSTMEITLSPKISQGNRVIVHALKEKFCPKLSIVDSTLQDQIR